MLKEKLADYYGEPDKARENLKKDLASAKAYKKKNPNKVNPKDYK